MLCICSENQGICLSSYIFCSSGFLITSLFSLCQKLNCPQPNLVLVRSNMPEPKEKPRASIFNFLVIFVLINYWQVYPWFVHLGVEIAAYSSVVDWDTCAYLLFCWEEEIFGGYRLQVGEQFLSGSLCYCGGKHSAWIVSILPECLFMHLLYVKYFFFCSLFDCSLTSFFPLFLYIMTV